MSAATTFKSLNQWNLREVAEVLRGRLLNASGEKLFIAISTDTRAIAKGDWFLALRGENFDGHNFCDQAIGAGAGGLILHQSEIADKHSSQLPVILVTDTLVAYGDLAQKMRTLWNGPVLALSGSVGKTTTRRLLASSISAHRTTLEPIKNFNNLIGLPQTLLRLTPEHEIAVLELGMNLPGELKRLTEIAAPNVAGLTRLGMTHVGMFKSLADLIEAKLDLFRGAKPGAPLVINAACANSAPARARFENDHPIVTFSHDPKIDADVRVENVTPLDNVGYSFDLRVKSQEIKGLEFRHFGRHHVEDAACASAMLLAANLDPEWIRDGLANFRSESYRGEIKQAGDWTFILDCYNASPDSMRASLQSLAEMDKAKDRAGRLVLVLADMLELGDHAKEAHTSLAELILSLKPDAYFGLGPHCAAIAESLKPSVAKSSGFENRATLIESLADYLEPGDRVFFKGSHGFALEKVAEALIEGKNTVGQPNGT